MVGGSARSDRDRGVDKGTIAAYWCCRRPPPQPSQSDAYPSRPVRIIFPRRPADRGCAYTPCRRKDSSARLGQRFIVENKPGAGTTVGTKAVAAAKPDGYVCWQPILRRSRLGRLSGGSAGYDPVTSFHSDRAVCRGLPFRRAPSSRAKTVKELVALAQPQASAPSPSATLIGQLHAPPGRTVSPERRH